MYLTEPLGSLFSGWITEQIGRKSSVYLAAIPSITAWLIFYFAQNTELMLLAAVLYGFSVGLLGAPLLTYIAEITYENRTIVS